ncbi:hypothetical protein ACLOJK_037388 [Asimina triloba]
MDQRQRSTRRFLLMLHPAVESPKACCLRFHHQQGLDRVHHLYHHRPSCPRANRHRPSCPHSTACAARCHVAAFTASTIACPLPAPVAASSPPSPAARALQQWPRSSGSKAHSYK